MKKVYQLLPTIALGDGVSQQAIEMERELQKAGYQCRTYADSIIGAELKKKIYPIEQLPETTDDDIIIYHLSTGSSIVEKLLSIKGKLIISYHNITPFSWYSEYDKTMERFCMLGRNDMHRLAIRADYCFADSEFNAQELREAGYRCPVQVLPIIIDFTRFGELNGIIDRSESTTKCNILFTGRVVPNKRVEKIIETFFYVKKYFLPNAVLDLVGTYSEDSSYYKKLVNYIKVLGVEDVHFQGHISEKELVSFYKKADLYLTLSGHEGFCIPILEAMYFQIPVIAHNSGAVGETMKGAGVLLDTLDALLIAGVLCDIIKSNELKERIIREQIIRVDEYIQKRDDKRWTQFFQ